MSRKSLDAKYNGLVSCVTQPANVVNLCFPKRFNCICGIKESCLELLFFCYSIRMGRAIGNEAIDGNGPKYKYRLKSSCTCTITFFLVFKLASLNSV